MKRFSFISVITAGLLTYCLIAISFFLPRLASRSDIRLQSNPRSIIETRRMGLA